MSKVNQLREDQIDSQCEAFSIGELTEAEFRARLRKLDVDEVRIDGYVDVLRYTSSPNHG